MELPKTDKTADVAAVTPEGQHVPNPTLRDKGIFYLCGGFNNEMSQKVVTWILEANLANKRDYDHLTLIINSPGGSVNAAFAIIDAIRGSAIPVHTIGLGMIGSCGLLTFIAGAKGHRTLTPNTSILSHQWSWGSYGKAHELLATVREFELTEQRMMAHYVKCTGMSEATIREKLLPPQDVWLSCEEARALGVTDNIKDLG